MKTFNLPKKLIDKISSDGEHTSQYTLFPTGLSSKLMEMTFVPFIAGLSAQIKDYYNYYRMEEEIRTGKPINYEYPRGILAVYDSLKNSLIHGSKNRNPVIYALFMGNLGVCHGFRDSGDYFKSQRIKELWENKKPLRKFGRPVEGFCGANFGVKGSIYPNVDFISVDTEKGLLFLIQFKNSLFEIKD